MSEISMYEAQKKKLQGLCDEHDLVYRFEKDRYPIIFTIKPVQGMDAQISMLENVEEVGYRSPDASMSWIFEDGGLDTKVTGGTFTISKTLRTKIESILVKMITYWQQYFFRDVLEKNALRSGLMPVIDEDEAGDTDEEPEDDIPSELKLMESARHAAAAVAAKNPYMLCAALGEQTGRKEYAAALEYFAGILRDAIAARAGGELYSCGKTEARNIAKSFDEARLTGMLESVFEINDRAAALNLNLALCSAYITSRLL